MNVEPEAVEAVPVSVEEASPWHPVKRILFRFSCLYFVLYAFSYPMSFFPLGALLTSWPGPIWQRIVNLSGTLFFDLSPELLKRKPSGSGDTTFDYVQLFSMVLMAVVGALLWSMLDRRHLHYRAWVPWLTAGVRFFVGGVILFYGFGKLLHLQFPAPSLNRLLTPYGDSSPMGLAWTFMGASAGYSFFAGLGEVVGAVLLFFRRTTTLGGLILIGVMGNVVMLNLCYDIPVKIFSSHLLLFSCALLVPDFKRLAALALNRTAERVEPIPLFAHPVRQQVAALIRGLVVVVLLVFNLVVAVKYKKEDSVKPPLYGIYDVETFTLNNEERAPLLTDLKRWKAVVFNWPGRVSIQGMDGTFKKYNVKVDLERNSMALSGFKGEYEDTEAHWSFERVSANTLAMEGELEGDRIRVLAHERDLDSFLLLNRGFHWINERPFNR